MVAQVTCTADGPWGLQGMIEGIMIDQSAATVQVYLDFCRARCQAVCSKQVSMHVEDVLPCIEHVKLSSWEVPALPVAYWLLEEHSGSSNAEAPWDAEQALLAAIDCLPHCRLWMGWALPDPIPRGLSNSLMPRRYSRGSCLVSAIQVLSLQLRAPHNGSHWQALCSFPLHVSGSSTTSSWTCDLRSSKSQSILLAGLSLGPSTAEIIDTVALLRLLDTLDGRYAVLQQCDHRPLCSFEVQIPGLLIAS